jgi:hypothetical protein
MARLPAPSLSAADRATVARLAAAHGHLRTSALIQAVNEEPTVRVLRRGSEVERDRAGYMSGLIIAAVALARRAA